MTRHRTPTPVRVGVFARVAQADRAVAELLEAGFRRDQISVICPKCGPGQFPDLEHVDPAGGHAAKAAAGGSAIGAVLGGLATIAGLTATGGLGLLAAGPLLAGMGGGAVAGGFIGAMLTRGLEPEVADFYDQALQRGRILVAVEPEPGPDEERRLAEAERAFEAAGAEPIPLREG
jgi:hypothetical protein